MGPIDIIQGKLGVPITDSWDPATLGAITVYQASNAGVFPMTPTGHPDPPTLINLGYYDPFDRLKPSWADYLDGGRKQPTTIGRDLAGASNVIPQAGWLALGALFLGLGALAWYRREK
jgi:hypothetical protein